MCFWKIPKENSGHLYFQIFVMKILGVYTMLVLAEGPQGQYPQRKN